MARSSRGQGHTAVYATPLTANGRPDVRCTYGLNVGRTPVDVTSTGDDDITPGLPHRRIEAQPRVDREDLITLRD